MSLLTPAWLLLAAMGLVVLILHVRRRRTFEMPSIQLWRMLDSGSLTRQRLRLPSPNLLLLLQLLIIALIALALARPLIGSRFAHEIVVLDASGSMRSRDVARGRRAPARMRQQREGKPKPPAHAGDRYGGTPFYHKER
jgi:Aerotolerance regulator N-terminal